LGRDQEAQYGAAVRLGNDFEYGFHAFIYTLYGIYVSRYMRNDRSPTLRLKAFHEVCVSEAANQLEYRSRYPIEPCWPGRSS
jgi:hypothetical protein